MILQLFNTVECNIEYRSIPLGIDRKLKNYCHMGALDGATSVLYIKSLKIV